MSFDDGRSTCDTCKPECCYDFFSISFLSVLDSLFFLRPLTFLPLQLFVPSFTLYIIFIPSSFHSFPGSLSTPIHMLPHLNQSRPGAHSRSSHHEHYTGSCPLSCPARRAPHHHTSQHYPTSSAGQAPFHPHHPNLGKFTREGSLLLLYIGSPCF